VREDFPARDDRRYLHHTVLRRSDTGRLVAVTLPVPPSNLDGLGLDGQAEGRLPEPTSAEGRPSP
jgi:L-aspartate oxidase